MWPPVVLILWAADLVFFSSLSHFLASRPRPQPPPQLPRHLLHRHPYLLRGIAVADGDGGVLQGLAVYGEAPGGAGFVLTAVAAADGPLVVVEDVEVRLQLAVEGPGLV